MLNIFKEPIQRKIIYIILMVTFGFASTSLFRNFYVGNKLNEAETKEHNQREKLEIGKLIVSKLLKQHLVIVHSVVEPDSRDLSFFKEQFYSLNTVINKLLNVLQHGGTFTNAFKVNLNDSDEVIKIIKYVKPKQESYTLEVINLRPKIIEIKTEATKIFDLKARIGLTEKLKQKNLTSIQNFEKLLHSLFIRSDEIARKIVVDVDIDLQIIKESKLHFEEKAETFLTRLKIAVILLISFISLLVIIQIEKILKEKEKNIELIKEASDNFNNVFYNSNDAVLLIDNSVIVGCNEAAVDILHAVSKKEIFNAHPSKLSPEFQPDGTKSVEKANKMIAMAHEKGFKRFEWTHKKMTGEEFPVEVNLTVIHRNGKKILHCFWKDISKEKMMIKKLKLSKNEAEAANKAKSEFLANMSHEIRTPLNGVIGFTDLLINSKLTPEQKQYAKIINTSADSLLEIINEILDFSKIEAGKLELEELKTDIIKLMEQTTDIISHKISEKNIELLLNIPPDIPRFAVVDPTRLKQIFINLLSNAVKFTKSGEIEFAVNFEQDEKNSSLGDFTFSVRDTGIGISDENKEKIFEAFLQADNSTTRNFGGTGLGLVISNRLAEKMGNKIVLESEVGKGSKFSITIKKQYEPGKQIDYDEIRNINTALIVDDNKNNRILLNTVLEKWNVQSILVSNGKSAIEKIENSEMFDAIIVDYNMPELDGLETIRTIKNLLKDSSEKLPVIILYSSTDDTATQKECQKLDVCRLVKPAKNSELFRALSGNTKSSNGIIAQDNETQTDIISDQKYSILIAEDVNINMMLIKTLLSQLIPSTLLFEAHNGKEAVQKYNELKPSLVFMDIHMPEMNGYTAASEIRKLEKNSDIHVPIIALTANAIKGEKEKCLAAGMDEYLTKPIELQALKKVLKEFLSPLITKTVEKESISPEKSKEDTDETDSEIHFDEEKFLERIGGEKELFIALIESSKSQFSEDLDNLNKALENNDLEVIRRAAHSIKGAALTMCFDILARMAKDTELIPDNEMSKMKESYNEMQKEWTIIQKELPVN